MTQDGHLLRHAAQMRREATPFEIILWRRLSRSQLGYKFRRQYVIGNTIVDFFCPERNVAVEVDGDTHDMARDALRDQFLRSRGIQPIRFSNSDIADNLEGVLQHLLAVLNTAPARWATPHPNPSPEGEGLSMEERP